MKPNLLVITGPLILITTALQYTMGSLLCGGAGQRGPLLSTTLQQKEMNRGLAGSLGDQGLQQTTPTSFHIVCGPQIKSSYIIISGQSIIVSQLATSLRLHHGPKGSSVSCGSPKIMILSVCSVPLRMDSNSGLLLLVEAMWSVRIIKNRPRVNQKVT